VAFLEAQCLLPVSFLSVPLQEWREAWSERGLTDFVVENLQVQGN